MSFKVKGLPEVDDDIKFALLFYFKINQKLPFQFLDRLEETYTLLTNNPFFEVKYKNVRTLKLKQFPYLTHFIVDEDLKEVIILAIAYAKENPVTYENRLPD